MVTVLQKVAACMERPSWTSLSSEDSVDSEEDQVQLALRDLAGAFHQLALVDGENQRHVGDGVPWQASRTRRQKDVARGICQPEVARQRYAECCRDLALIEAITLNDNDGASEPRLRADRLRQVGPPDFSLMNHHSTRRSTSCAVSVTKRSSGSATESQTALSRSVMVSGLRRVRYSIKASV